MSIHYEDQLLPLPIMSAISGDNEAPRGSVKSNLHKRKVARYILGSHRNELSGNEESCLTAFLHGGFESRSVIALLNEFDHMAP